MSKYTIASVSCGKDSLVIPYEYIRRGLRLDEVIMYDTGMEFQAIYDEWAALVNLLDENGIKHTVLHPEYSFYWQMFERPVNMGKENEHLGYSWCGGTCRWGTADKRTILGKYAEERDAIVLVGIAADEPERKEKEFKPYKRFPLIEWKMAEADCLAYSYQRGHEWREHGANTPDGTIRLRLQHADLQMCGTAPSSPQTASSTDGRLIHGSGSSSLSGARNRRRAKHDKR